MASARDTRVPAWRPRAVRRTDSLLESAEEVCPHTQARKGKGAKRRDPETRPGNEEAEEYVDEHADSRIKWKFLNLVVPLHVHFDSCFAAFAPGCRSRSE